MSNVDPIALFDAIDENVRSGTFALKHTLLQAKAYAARTPSSSSIRRPNTNLPDGRALAAESTARVAHLLLAAQYEARLAWLIWHPSSRLSEQQRESALRGGGLAARWKQLLKLALSDRLGRLDPPITLSAADIPQRLPREYRRFYFDLVRVAKNHLDPLIDTRNSLAHGEWRTALTRTADGFNEPRTGQLGEISLFRVTVLANLLDHYWKCYFDALVTYEAFERDFRAHHRRMMHASVRLSRADEERWVANLRRRFKDGRSSHGGLSYPPEPMPVWSRRQARGEDGTLPGTRATTWHG